MPNTTPGKIIANLRKLDTKFDQGTMRAETIWPEFCWENKSTGSGESYAGLGSVGNIKEWIGDRQFGRLAAQDFRIENTEYEDGIELEKVKLQDDQIGIYGQVLGALGKEMVEHPDDLFLQLEQEGSVSQCLDGQNFFDTDHQFGRSGVQSNMIQFAVVDPDNPTPLEVKAAYYAGLKVMISLKKDNGKNYFGRTVSPAKLKQVTCTIPLDLDDSFTSAFEAKLIGGGDTNVVRYKPKHVPLINSPTPRKFRIYYTGSNLKPFIFQPRRPITRQTHHLDSNLHKNVLYAVDYRAGIGYFAWWNAVEVEFVAI